jgi:hypothetical protein
MDSTALYYALSTIAQCAAALAALIGFLGLWRLDRLREEARQIEPQLRELMSRTGRLTPTVQRVPGERPDLHRIPRWELNRRIDDVIANPQTGIEQEVQPALQATRQRGRHLPGEQQRLLRVLRIFLGVTLIILLAAIVGFLFVDQIKHRWWTPWALGLASLALVWFPFVVVFVASRPPLTTVALALWLALATPALAGTTRCTTYEEKTLGRLQTICDDGTRGVSTYNRSLERWDTTITESPRKACTGRMNAITKQIEVRCR